MMPSRPPVFRWKGSNKQIDQKNPFYKQQRADGFADHFRDFMNAYGRSKYPDLPKQTYQEAHAAGVDMYDKMKKDPAKMNAFISENQKVKSSTTGQTGLFKYFRGGGGLLKPGQEYCKTTWLKSFFDLNTKSSGCLFPPHLIFFMCVCFFQRTQ
jgi:hypothetical protein